MAARTAGVITINLSAGTAALIIDLERAKGRFKDFARDAQVSANAASGAVDGVSRSVKRLGTTGVSDMQATAATLRTIEGGMTNNLRAAERFLASVLKIGPALQTLFPLVGAIAFAGVILRMGEELYAFFKKIHDAPDAIRKTFRDLNQSIAESNDQLQLNNARLEEEIRKIEKKPGDGLRVGLYEARLEAEKLAQSLDSISNKVEEALKKHALTVPQQIFSHSAGITGLQDEAKRFAAVIDEITARGRAHVAVVTRDIAAGLVKPGSEKTAQDEMDENLREAYAAEVRNLTRQKRLKNTAPPTGGPMSLMPVATPDLTIWNTAIQGMVDAYQGAGEDVGARSAGAVLKIDKNDAEQKAENARLAKERARTAEQERKLEEKNLREGYDRDLAGRESGDEKLLPSDKLAFKQDELAQIELFNGRYKELEQELIKEIASLRQQDLAAGQAGRDKDLKAEEAYQKKLAAEKFFWAMQGIHLTKSEETSAAKQLRTDTGLGAGTRGGSTAEGKALGEKQLEGTPLETSRLLLKDAGISTITIQEANINQEKRILALLQQGNYTIGQQLDQRERILKSQIALGIAEGKDVSAQQIALATTQRALKDMKDDAEGWAPFFANMADAAKSPRDIAQQGITSGIDKLSGDLTKLVTDDHSGRRTHWGRMFGDTAKSVGHELTSAAIKSGIDKVIAKIGLKKESLWGKSEGTAWYVRFAHSKIDRPFHPPPPIVIINRVDAAGAPPDIGIDPSLRPPNVGPNSGTGFGFPASALGFSGGTNLGRGGSSASGASPGWGIAASLIGLATSLIGFGGGGGGGAGGGGGGASYIPVSSGFSFGGALAEGADDVSPGKDYIVGDRGEAEIFRPGTHGSVTPISKLQGGGGTTVINHNNNIDARGADLGASNRIQQGMQMTYRSSVSTSIQANSERSKRTTSTAI